MKKQILTAIAIMLSVATFGQKVQDEYVLLGRDVVETKDATIRRTMMDELPILANIIQVTDEAGTSNVYMKVLFVTFKSWWDGFPKDGKAVFTLLDGEQITLTQVLNDSETIDHRRLARIAKATGGLDKAANNSRDSRFRNGTATVADVHDVLKGGSQLQKTYNGISATMGWYAITHEQLAKIADQGVEKLEIEVIGDRPFVAVYETEKWSAAAQKMIKNSQTILK